MGMPEQTEEKYKLILNDLKLANQLNPNDKDISEYMKYVCEQYINI